MSSLNTCRWGWRMGAWVGLGDELLCAGQLAGVPACLSAARLASSETGFEGWQRVSAGVEPG